MIMHKNVIICTCMIINNLALHLGGGEKTRSDKGEKKKKIKRRKKKRKGHTGQGVGRGGEGETGEVRERVALRASIRGIKVTVQFDERRVQRGKRGGGLAAAVTSSFMNSLYFCSVQNKRTFLLKKMTKKYKT